MLYLLDTNIFIQAKNLHYGMDFCPAFRNATLTTSAPFEGAPEAAGDGFSEHRWYGIA
jgi:hypothetical protein